MQNGISESADHISNHRHIPDQSGGVDLHRPPAPSWRTAKQLFGKLFECMAEDVGCHTKSIQFGSVRICSWPLKEHADGLDVHIPPCLEGVESAENN